MPWGAQAGPARGDIIGVSQRLPEAPPLDGRCGSPRRLAVKAMQKGDRDHERFHPL